jgi:GTPase SAR1 family protein
VVFDVTKKHSFDAVPSWIYDIRERSDENVVIGIIGNKVDLERVVSKQEGQTLADHSQAFYMETTIHDLNLLKDAFTRLA